MADEHKKSESPKHSEKHTEHKGEHKHAEHEKKPAAKATPHPTSKTTGSGQKSEKTTGAHKKTEAASKRAEGKPAPKAGKGEGVKIVDAPAKPKYSANPKAQLSDEQKKALQTRREIAGRRPWFRRQQWYEYKRLANSGWRKPTGVDSAMRRHFGYEQSVVRVGFGGPKAVRGLHASGFREVYVSTSDDLKGIDAKTQAVRFNGNLGARKLRELYKEADKLGLHILNRRNLPEVKS